MPRIRHIGGHGSILTAKGGALAGGASSFVGATMLNTDAGSGATVNVPAGVQDKDFLFAASFAKNSNGFNAPTGWAKLGGFNSGATMELFVRKAGGAEPASYTFTGVGSSDRTFIMAAYRDVKGVFDLDQIPYPDRFTGIASNPYVMTPHTLTAKRTGRYLLFAVSTSFTPTVSVPPSGMTQRVLTTPPTTSYGMMGLWDIPASKGEIFGKSISWGNGFAASFDYLAIPLLI